MDISFAIPSAVSRGSSSSPRITSSSPYGWTQPAAGGRCPECGQASRSVHSRYHRQPPTCRSLSQTTLRIEMRRFYCLDPTCRRRTFAETPIDLLAPRARRTRRLYEAQARVGLACGGAGGARLLAHLHMPASRATVLRLVTRMPMPDTPAPIWVGIDDRATRKGSCYGTIVVDLLPGRTAPTMAGWLERHPGVELVAQDRRAGRCIASSPSEPLRVFRRLIVLGQAAMDWSPTLA